jgi:glycerophosphoryl diester phosphodiesterase
MSMGIHPLLLGHRGTRGEKSVAENTPAAFDFALSCGCDGFEFDVRLSADGKAVICHDARTTTTTTRRTGGIEIAQAPALQLGLPLLRDVLTCYQPTAFLDIELKVPGLETITADLLRRFAPVRGFVVSSFLPQVLEALHATDTTIPLGLICENRAALNRWPQLPVEYVIPHHKLLTRDLLQQMKSAGKKVLVWTVNMRADMKRFAQWEVDGTISDHPKRLALTLDRGRVPKTGMKTGIKNKD